MADESRAESTRVKLRGSEPVANRRGQTLRLEKKQCCNLAVLFDDKNLARSDGRLEFVKSGQLIGETIKKAFNQTKDLRRVTFCRKLDPGCRRSGGRRDGRGHASEAHQPRVTAKSALFCQSEKLTERRLGSDEISRKFIGCECWEFRKFLAERRSVGSRK